MTAISPVSTAPTYTPPQASTAPSRPVDKDGDRDGSKPAAPSGSSTGKLVNVTA
jgi:hypothetical protein